MKNSVYDAVIVGSGVAGCFNALHLPKDWNILMITKSSLEDSDSFLAQGGICVLKDENDYDSFYEDTMKAGHYENRPEAVREMIVSSREVINELIEFGVDFHMENGELSYTKEGAHSTNRILYYKDITGKEITRKLLARVKELENVTIKTNTEMIDILCKDNCCDGILLRNGEGELEVVFARHTMWACGGIGGIYDNSTNFTHLTGDAIALSIKHGINIKNINYVQIHPTTLYSNRKERRFLVSESVRGEGAVLLDKNGNRFVDELQPRDVVSKAIFEQMKKDKTKHVWLSMMTIKDMDVTKRFPYICQRCLEEGIDVTKDLIPVVPAQHYFMGGVDVDLNSHTSMRHLYASGETCCNGVHGANRLASNSLLESLVFAKNAALHMNKVDKYTIAERNNKAAETGREDMLYDMSKWEIDKIIEKYNIDLNEYENYEKYSQNKKDIIWAEINKANGLGC